MASSGTKRRWRSTRFDRKYSSLHGRSSTDEARLHFSTAQERPYAPEGFQISWQRSLGHLRHSAEQVGPLAAAIDSTIKWITLCPMPRRFRLWFVILCALTLTFAQQAALAHSVGHALSWSAGDEPSLPHSKVCEQCHQAGQLGLGLISQAPALYFSACFAKPVVHPRSVHEQSTRPPFSSRAPPAILA